MMISVANPPVQFYVAQAVAFDAILHRQRA
jgi:hypothetical protein